MRRSRFWLQLLAQAANIAASAWHLHFRYHHTTLQFGAHRSEGRFRLKQKDRFGSGLGCVK